MKIFFFFLSYLISYSCFSRTDTCNYQQEHVIKYAIKGFIDSIKSDGSKYNVYNVYVMQFYFLSEDSSDISFTIGYIRNSMEFKEIEADYYFKVEDEFVVVRVPNQSYLKKISFLELKEISPFGKEQSKIRIVQKLYPRDVGFLTYGSSGLIFSGKGCSAVKKFYSNARLIPEDISLFKRIPAVREKIDTAQFMKKMSEKKKYLK